MSEERKRFIGQFLTGVCLALIFGTSLKADIFGQFTVVGYFLILVDSFLFRKRPEERIENFRVGAVLVLFPVATLAAGAWAESTLRPTTYDVALRAIDLRLGVDGFAWTRFCLAHPAVLVTLSAVYSGLPTAIALGWVSSRSHTLLRASLIAPILAFPCYLLVPACGPEYAFSDWPWQAAHFVASGLVGRPRNCVPSMHFTWALLLAINSPNRVWTVVFSLYVALMAIVTVAGGEHYFVDILVAIPFTFIIQAISARLPGWIKATNLGRAQTAPVSTVRE